MKTLSYFFLALFLGQAFGTPVNPACLSALTGLSDQALLEERDFSSIVSSLGKDFQSRFRLNRRAANRSYEWRGPDRSQALRAVQTDYAYEFSPEGLAYHKERDRNPFAVVETAFTQVAMEQGRKAFQRSPQMDAIEADMAKIKEAITAGNRDEGTRLLAGVRTKVKNAPVEFLRSLTLDPVMSDKSVPARSQWPQAGGPLPNHELFARYQDALFNFYTVKDKQGRSVDRNDPALAAHFEELLVQGMRQGVAFSNKVSRFDGLELMFSILESSVEDSARDRQLQHFQSASEWFEKIRNGTY